MTVLVEAVPVTEWQLFNSLPILILCYYHHVIIVPMELISSRAQTLCGHGPPESLSANQLRVSWLCLDPSPKGS